jgi:hypothetical protein
VSNSTATGISNSPSNSHRFYNYCTFPARKLPRSRNLTFNVFTIIQTSQDTLREFLVDFIRLVLLFLVLRLHLFHIRFGPLFANIGFFCQAQHGFIPAPSCFGRGAPVPAMRPRRRADFDRRRQLQRHGPHRHQHLLLLAMRQDGWLQVNTGNTKSGLFMR